MSADAGSEAASRSPARDCPFCPRLHDFRTASRRERPAYFNAPVPSFGPVGAALLIVGLAPGLHGANRTGRPFTGDYAGDLLYETLATHGFSRGAYGREPDDGLTLVNCRITNAVRCVPPENKPTPAETATCRRFLVAELEAMPALRAIVALGAVAHASTVTALGGRPARHPFVHGAVHTLAGGGARGVAGGVTLFNSYHCSRYNTNTGRLTPAMFNTVFAAVRRHLDAPYAGTTGTAAVATGG